MPSGMGGVSVFQEVFGLTRLGETDHGTLAVYRPEEWLERVQPFLEETPVSRTDW